MKKHLTALFLTAVMVVSAAVTPAWAVVTTGEDELPDVGEEICGFKVTDRGEYRAAEAETVTFSHIKSGATLFLIKNDDKNLAFNISYRTPQTDESDRNHVFEHAILASSEKYPATDIFFDVANKTYNTFVNASTGFTTTNYMVASMSSEQLKKMMDVYLSCMVEPGIMENENFFKREALNYTLESPDADIELGGTVFSEDTGYLTDISYRGYNSVIDSLYPGETASNMIGCSVENYKLLTYDHVKELYDLCYHFDNSIITLYGDIDYRDYLKFIDEEYLSKYSDNNTDLSEYLEEESEPKFVDNVIYAPAYEGDTVENASVVNYAIDLEGYSYEDIMKISYLCNVLSSDSSVLSRKLQEAGIFNSYSCSVNIDSYKPFMTFDLYNADPEIREDFMNVVKDSLKEISENGAGASYDNIMKNIEISESLQSESYDFGVNSAVLLSTYWAATGETDLFDVDSEAFDEMKADKNQTIIKELAARLLEPENSAIVATVPKPGLAEEINNERTEYLADMKESMSDTEIKAMVEETAEYNEWNANPVHNNNVSISPDELPEPEEYPDVEVKTLGDVTNYSVEIERSVGKYSLAFDVSSIKQEDLYYLYLYSMLLSSLDTDNYTSDELSEIMLAYLNGGSVNLTYKKLKDSDVYTPMLTVDWYSRSEDYSASLDILLDILENTDFSNAEDIIPVLEGILPYYDPARTNDPLGVVQMAGLSGLNEEYKFNMYFEGKEFYEFLENTLNSLKSDEEYSEELSSKLDEMADRAVNKSNIIATVICDEEGIAEAEKINNEVLNKLPESEGERAVYDFGEVYKNTAYIAELSNQYSFFASEFAPDFKGEYMPYISMINDKYTVPTLRFSNGAYSAATGFMLMQDNGVMYSYSYSDPNVGKTVEAYKNMVKAFEETEITQEELDSYIVASYSGFVVPEGDYTRADTAITYEILGFDRNIINEYAEGIKNSSAEDMDAALKCIQNMADNGYLAFIGNSQDINGDKELFDDVIDLRE